MNDIDNGSCCQLGGHLTVTCKLIPHTIHQWIYSIFYYFQMILQYLFFFLFACREFYYIQMEKHAREAIGQGIKSADDIHVNGSSGIYETLNQHYNRNKHIEVSVPINLLRHTFIVHVWIGILIFACLLLLSHSKGTSKFPFCHWANITGILPSSTGRQRQRSIVEEANLQNHFAYGWSSTRDFQIAWFFSAAGIDDTKPTGRNKRNYFETIRTSKD